MGKSGAKASLNINYKHAVVGVIHICYTPKSTGKTI